VGLHYGAGGDVGYGIDANWQTPPVTTVAARRRLKFLEDLDYANDRPVLIVNGTAGMRTES